jgi:hypothetical protein
MAIVFLIGGLCETLAHSPDTPLCKEHLPSWDLLERLDILYGGHAIEFLLQPLVLIQASGHAGGVPVFPGGPGDPQLVLRHFSRSGLPLTFGLAPEVDLLVSRPVPWDSAPLAFFTCDSGSASVSFPRLLASLGT